MGSLNLLDKIVPYSFVTGANAGGDVIDEPSLIAEAEAMASAINAIEWQDPLAEAFKAMNSIVFFVGEVPFSDSTLTRSFSDQPNGVFYWQANEFIQDSLPTTRASYFLHDCWHVVQYNTLGGASPTDQEEIRREVDAMTQQIAAARALNCPQNAIDFLNAYMNNGAAIQARVDSGYIENVACPGCAASSTSLAASMNATNQA